ncbi:hypothetical protein SUDANB176_06740 [Streptomyces sp. enrichment culture]
MSFWAFHARCDRAFLEDNHIHLGNAAATRRPVDSTFLLLAAVWPRLEPMPDAGAQVWAMFTPSTPLKGFGGGCAANRPLPHRSDQPACPRREDFLSTLEEHVSNEQRDQQAPRTPTPQQTPKLETNLAKQGAVAAIGGAFSGAARAVMAHLLGDGS